MKLLSVKAPEFNQLAMIDFPKWIESNDRRPVLFEKQTNVEAI